VEECFSQKPRLNTRKWQVKGVGMGLGIDSDAARRDPRFELVGCPRISHALIDQVHRVGHTGTADVLTMTS
jgi:hypothetical protein